ncbi:hypothetical protein K9L16_04255 [Candidatus Pacearchaeota archaeon]|nr:hypothetical protein [Candidatus Pacearchaeota archaeon]
MFNINKLKEKYLDFPHEILNNNFIIDKNNLKNWLINTEQKYGGLVQNVPRRKVSKLDPRSKKVINKNGMTGGDRMSPNAHDYAKYYAKYLTQWVGRRVILVEVGILTGIGLAIWSELFTEDSRIIGLDIDLSHFNDNKENLKLLGAFKKNNVEIYEFDQFLNNQEYLKTILKKDKVNILIDDGFHSDNSILTTLNSFKSHLAKESVCFIEDNNTIVNKLNNYDISDNYFTVIKNNGFKKWLYKTTDYIFDLDHPKSFNEKINWKKLNDRNPYIPLTSDKIDSRKYVLDILHDETILKPLIYETSDPESIPFENLPLPKKYVIKPNHLSGKVLFVDLNISKKEIIKICKEWLNIKYYPHAMEWAYEPIIPKILIEPIIGNPPESYKFHMVHNKCELIQVNQGYFNDKTNRELTIFDINWNKLDNILWIYPPSKKNILKPKEFDKLIDYSIKLSNSFDYVRIDFNIINDKIYFEEITHYPTSGHARIKPIDFDFKLGEKWII